MKITSELNSKNANLHEVMMSRTAVGKIQFNILAALTRCWWYFFDFLYLFFFVHHGDVDIMNSFKSSKEAEKFGGEKFSSELFCHHLSTLIKFPFIVIKRNEQREVRGLNDDALLIVITSMPVERIRSKELLMVMSLSFLVVCWRWKENDFLISILNDIWYPRRLKDLGISYEGNFKAFVSQNLKRKTIYETVIFWLTCQHQNSCKISFDITIGNLMENILSWKPGNHKLHSYENCYPIVLSSQNSSWKLQVSDLQSIEQIRTEIHLLKFRESPLETNLDETFNAPRLMIERRQVSDVIFRQAAFQLFVEI